MLLELLELGGLLRNTVAKILVQRLELICSSVWQIMAVYPQMGPCFTIPPQHALAQELPSPSADHNGLLLSTRANWSIGDVEVG